MSDLKTQMYTHEKDSRASTKNMDLGKPTWCFYQPKWGANQTTWVCCSDILPSKIPMLIQTTLRIRDWGYPTVFLGELAEMADQEATKIGIQPNVRMI